MKFIKRKRFWGLLLAAGLLVYCFYDFDFHSVLAALSSLNIRYLIPLIFLEIVIAVVRTLRLKIIIDPIKRVGFTFIFPIYCIGMMTNLLMPFLTGQVARLYIISKKTRLAKTFIFTTTVLEVLFDGMALLGIVLLISLFFVIPSQFKAWHFILLGSIVLVVLISLLVLSRSQGKSHDFISRFTVHL
ncbi:MAG: lysylphosphatidylglycerol synthase transmembrane domain-containing protein, partial [candidate division Zixibacteria bacterium]